MDDKAESRTDPQDRNRLNLPALLDLAAARTLCQSLRQRLLGNEPVILDGSGVERVSTPGVQILLAAAAEARTRGLRFQ